MTYNNKLFILRIVRIVISYMKPYNCVQTNDYYLIEIITWNHIISSIR